MKKFINRPEDVVDEMLRGLAMLHPGSAQLQGYKVMIRSDAVRAHQSQVAIISGGGSGHEPAHAGYIGTGMLSAAVAGEVFTSPSSDSVFAAIQAVAGKPGALLVVKNYTGDRLNFGLAAEMARTDGIAVETVLVNDDVALKGTTQPTGARGLAGTVFIHKLVGAAAAEGMGSADLAAMGRAAVASLATMGVSLSAGTSPVIGKPSFELGDHEMELGLGIHGEPGVTKTNLQPADEVVETLLTRILKHGEFGEERRVAVMVNNLGATTEMELAIVARHVKPFLERKGFTVERIYAGTFLSSLDMAGMSISVLGVNDERLRWLDAPTTAPAWPNAPRERPGKAEAKIVTEIGAKISSRTGNGAQSALGRKTQQGIEAACIALIGAKDELAELDRITGDGDLGASMERAAKAVQRVVASYPLDDTPAALKAIGHTLRRELGGSSGPLYGVLCLRCGSVLGSRSGRAILDLAEALQQGCMAISELGGARPGDRTMLDALHPFVETLKEHAARGESPKQAVMAAVEAAERGVESTLTMKPRLGRSSYLGDRVLGHPDPGARAVAIWLRAACEAFLGS
jgi:dihydroxyacetone kinase